MKVKQLIDILSKVNPELECVLDVDGENIQPELFIFENSEIPNALSIGNKVGCFGNEQLILIQENIPCKGIFEEHEWRKINES